MFIYAQQPDQKKSASNQTRLFAKSWVFVLELGKRSNTTFAYQERNWGEDR
jgi:hypothetical protein